ncbi:hypothetical protein SBDP1_680042 [Syntrophobacter sp. SbD1]|nr:hypothetical protein SBDP1_680042 [Syntrophobacter sp. SbD1]
MSPQVHGEDLHVVENQVFRVPAGIKILFQNYKIVVIMMQFAQGERWTQRMDDPKVKFLECLRDPLGAFNISVAE